MPDIFLVQEEVALLVQALKTFALEVDTPEGRKDILTNAGIHLSFRTRLMYETSPFLFANRLVAAFREYRIPAHRPAYHPMVSLLEYLLQTYELEDHDRLLFTRLVRKSRNNFDVLTARGAVGRIESPPGEAIGTGVYVGKQYLLTCRHVIEHVFEQGRERAWIRFGYKMGRWGTESGELFELNIKNFYQDIVVSESNFDYALVKIIDKIDFPAARLSHRMFSPQQEIRIIHHPRGEPVHISDIGAVVQVEEEFIKHNVEVDHGSSGAPIFDLDWNVIALHRGVMALSRPSAPGITEGVPLFGIWRNIQPYLSVPQPGDYPCSEE